MIIANKSVGVINVGGTVILPGQTGVIADSFEKNPVVAGLMRSGKLEKLEKAMPKEEDKQVNLTEAVEKLLEGDPTTNKLKAFAKKYGINIAEAKNDEEMIALIRAYAATQTA